MKCRRGHARYVVVSVMMALLVFAASCTDFDVEQLIEDTRVIAVRSEPAEVFFSPLFLTPAAQRPPLPLPTVEVHVEVFAFDPRGGRSSLSRQLCPELPGDSTCRLYDAEVDLLDEPETARPIVRELVTPVAEENEISLEASPLGRIEPATFTWRFTPEVIDFVIADDDNGNPIPSIFPFLPRVVVDAKNLDVAEKNAALSDGEEPAVERERAFKRIPVSLDITSPDLPPDVAADFARGLGFELCDEPISPEVHDLEQRATCLQRRVPNQNPSLRGFFLEGDPNELSEGALTTDDVPPDLGLGSLVRVSPGSVLAVSPVFEPEPAERYQVLSFDIEASRVVLLNRVEDLACTWYSTRGSVSDGQTALQFGKGLGITWSLPSNAKAGERDTLLLVVLDQRGGTSLAEITVVYR